MKKNFTIVLLTIMSWALCAQTQQYLHFDRDDDYVRVENASDLVLNGTEISMAGWFYSDELIYGQGMMGFRSGTNGFYIIQLDDGVLECRLNSTTGLHEYVAPSFTALPEQWQHFAWVYDGSSVKLYVDGNLSGQSTASGTIVETGVPFAIGRSILSNLDFYFGGRADEVSLWSKALSQTEIQDMISNELTGTETGLELYYKFNQGAPGGDNTSITTLDDETGTQDGDLIGFAMMGNTSNFDGDFDSTFQAITFPSIEDKLISEPAFTLNASSSAGLPIDYSIISGPVSISGNTVTLDGIAGTVIIEASQPGNTNFQAATPIQTTFEVLDPALVTPNVVATNPLAGDVVVPNLGAIQLAAIVDIPFTAQFSVQSVEFEVDGQVYQSTLWKDGHYTSYWTPPDYGNYTVNIRAYNNFGFVNIVPHAINIVQSGSDQNVEAFSGVIINTAVASQNVTADLPSFMGAYNTVTANLDVRCPPGQVCGEWDRVARVMLKTHEGEWIEFIKYITPYGTACMHSSDVTDFISALQGKIEFRVECTTFDTGYDYNLTLDYSLGTPTYNYSLINKMWHGSYPFGDPADLQPTEDYIFSFPEFTESAKLKLVASGHGWGNNNTGNAAEFHEDTHHILVDDIVTFDQHNWNICNPNPDGCQPQSGTWFNNRAGWCPGAIADFFDYDFTSYINQNTVNIKYRFDEDYVDNCHPNNPNCVTGVTCADCDDGFNPHLIVASSMITFSNTPPEVELVDVQDLEVDGFSIFPNPASNYATVRLINGFKAEVLNITDISGKLIYSSHIDAVNGNNISVDTKELESGIYYITLKNTDGLQKTLPLVISK